MSKKTKPYMQRRRPLTPTQKQFRAERYVRSLRLPPGHPVEVFVSDYGEISAIYSLPDGWNENDVRGGHSTMLPPRTTIR